jgi:acetyl esterase/lipase
MTDPDLEQLREETRAFNVELERQLGEMPSIHTLPVEETRRARRDGGGIYAAPVFLPEAGTIEIEGPAGSLPLRIIRRAEPSRGAFLHFHGGGWALGENDMQDVRLMGLAEATGLTVISVGYRLAPESPYPAGPDDCEAAALWLLSPEGREFAGEGPLATGGDSAGGQLTALTLLRLRDRHGITGAFSAAVFQYGAFDLSMTPSQRLWGDRNLVLSEPIISWFADYFLPGYDLEQRRDPEISPLYAKLHDMPPAMFTVGTEDPLLDDTLFMEARWRMAGAPTELKVWHEAPHGFLNLPMRVTDAALSAEHDFLRRTLELTD